MLTFEYSLSGTRSSLPLCSVDWKKINKSHARHGGGSSLH